jgi:hypothetical protein
VAGILEELTEHGKGPAARVAAYSAAGSLVLYLLGYLTLRFHLTFLGVATDLGAFDERYLFAGANFLVYLASSLPIAGLLAAVAAALLWVAYLVLPSNARGAVRGQIQRRSASPVAPAALGIAVSLGLLQIAMRKCFVYANVLLMDRLPETAPFLNTLLTGESGRAFMQPYFGALIAGLAGTTALLLQARRNGHRPLQLVLALLVAVQALLLPINFGVLVHGKSFPRVTAVGKRALASGERAWLACDGKSTLSYLLQHPAGDRSLITIDRETVKDVPIEITGYDDLAAVFSVAKAPQASRAP